MDFRPTCGLSHASASESMTRPFIPFGRPLIADDELRYANEALSSGKLVHGSFTEAFEREFAEMQNVVDAVSVSSCTAGLHLSLFCAGIGPGDFVAVPAMTHVATAHVVELVGARPIFVDVSPDDGNVDIEALEHVAANVPLKAIMPVHYLGLPCKMQEISAIAERLEAEIFEDCALAVGATYDGSPMGSFGKSGSFSFYPTKHMTSIEGGMVTTNDEAFGHALRKKRAFGYDKSLQQRTRPGHYDVDELGFNYRMNEVEAAVGVAQLRNLESALLARQRNDSILREAALSCALLTVFPNNQGGALSSHYCFNILLPNDGSVDRDKLQDGLTEAGIGTSIHYPKAIPLMKYYASKYGYEKGSFPVAEWIADYTISLPVGPHVSEDDARFIAETFVKTVEQVSK